jgi:hypothetical protein
LNLWVDRLRETDGKGQAQTPDPEVAEEAGPMAAKTLIAQGGAGQTGSGASGGQSSERPQVQPTVRLDPTNTTFQTIADEVNVRSPTMKGSLDVTQARSARLAARLDEIIRGQARMTESGSVARVEVEIDGERISLRVRLVGNVVDVSLAGLEAAEIDQLRDELSERLREHAMELGDLRQEMGSEEERRAEEESGSGADGASGRTGDRDGASADRDQRRTELQRARHDGTLYVTA